MAKYVYAFEEGNKDMRELLGGKGANLAEMTNLGLPVPHGFTITTEACQIYYEKDRTIPQDIETEISAKLKELESKSGKNFGDAKNPLLVSVRSGSRASMPGMMDTILNLGLNDDVAAALSDNEENKRFIYDSYRRLIMMFANVVKGYSKDTFERHLDTYKKDHNKKSDLDLTAADWFTITNDYKKIYKEIVKEEFPIDPMTQLIEAVKAVFNSWKNERAIYYRKLNHIPEDWGTAVNIQEMVYGNLNEFSGTGVAFSRNPSTGEDKLYGEYLINAQGEDVVSGVRTPENILTLKDKMPDIYEQFLHIAKQLEQHYHDMQDMEFTIENNKLYILQTRNGKRTATAAIKIAVDMVKEGLITKEEAILRVEPEQIESLLHPTFQEESLKNAAKIAHGLAASPGAAVGRICFEASEAIAEAKKGLSPILVRLETSPEDIEGMHSSSGVLTLRGGMTSHAAVVARGMGRCCITGCNDLEIDMDNQVLITKNGVTLKKGDTISLDGNTGNVYEGAIETTEATISGDFETFMNWVDENKSLKVRANAETVKDAEVAMKFNAEGIGLCRTEHMFFSSDRIFNFRKMILATTKQEREDALAEILTYQKADFVQLFQIVAPHSIVIRYLDPPLHEFLPKTDPEIQALAESLHITKEVILNRIKELKEANPMMGHRGCRLAITFPEIAVMQTRAIIEAAIQVSKQGKTVKPEIMIPLVGDAEELKFVKDIVMQTANKIMTEQNYQIEIKIGTMIELPRAAIMSASIAEEASFFSYGTNDLTQMTYGFSRDDAGKFLESYYQEKIFTQDPFVHIDEEGVGRLMEISIAEAKKVNSNIELGVCGEHGGDAQSINFFNKIGLDYVSCSPYRVPIAKLAAAQANIKNGRN